MQEGPNEILTINAKSRLRANAIRFRVPEDEAETSGSKMEPSTGRGKRSVVLPEQTRHKQTNEEKRKERQRELLDQINKEARQRLSIKHGESDERKYIRDIMMSPSNLIEVLG